MVSGYNDLHMSYLGGNRLSSGAYLGLYGNGGGTTPSEIISDIDNYFEEEQLGINAITNVVRSRPTWKPGELKDTVAEAHPEISRDAITHGYGAMRADGSLRTAPDYHVEFHPPAEVSSLSILQ